MNIVIDQATEITNLNQQKEIGRILLKGFLINKKVKISV